MSNRTVLLIHHDPDLPSFFRRGFERTGIRFVAMHNRRSLSANKLHPYAAYIVEAHEACVAHLRKLDLPEGNSPWVTIAPAALLRSTFDVLKPQILQVIHIASGSTRDAHTAASGPNKSSRESFQEYIGKRLHHFVRQSKAGGGRNLHALIVHELEKPLITLTLKEMNGNQIRAARLLGMNRNTLRKKIKALHIPMDHLL